MVCSRAFKDKSPGSPCYNLILLEDDIPTFSRLQQSMTPSNPTPPPSPSMYLHICKHGPILFAPTKADPSRGEGSHSPSGPSLRLPRRMVTKKEKGRGVKKLILREHNPTECLPVSVKCEKEKKYIFTVSYFGKAYFL